MAPNRKLLRLGGFQIPFIRALWGQVIRQNIVATGVADTQQKGC